MKAWRLHMQASRLIGRADFVAAGSIYEQLVASMPTDSFASMMLALCYEQQGRHREALRLAEEGVRCRPQSLLALQTAGRLTVAVDDHDRAARYLQQALSLPEVRTEIPKESALPKLIIWTLRVLLALPVLRRRVRRDALRELDLGAQALELQDWKRWAQEYLAWHAGSEPGGRGSLVH